MRRRRAGYVHDVQDTKEYWDRDDVVYKDTALWPGEYNIDLDPAIEELQEWCLYFNIQHGSRIIEGGCGGGRALALWDYCSERYGWDFKLEGLDHSPKAIEVAKTYIPNATFHVMGIEEMIFDEEFDIVCTRISLQHNSGWKQKQIFSCIHKALKKNGLFYMIKESTFTVNDHDIKSGFQHDTRQSAGTAAWWIKNIAQSNFDLLEYREENYTWKKISVIAGEASNVESA